MPKGNKCYIVLLKCYPKFESDALRELNIQMRCSFTLNDRKDVKALPSMLKKVVVCFND